MWTLHWMWWSSIALLGGLYCLLTFYLAIVFIAKDDDVEILGVRFGAIAISCISFVPVFWWDSLPVAALVALLSLIVVVAFFAYAIELGLIVKQAVIATVLFVMMYFPGFWAVQYFLSWLVADGVVA